jgi:hypothetical protein
MTVTPLRMCLEILLLLCHQLMMLCYLPWFLLLTLASLAYYLLTMILMMAWMRPGLFHQLRAFDNLTAKRF